ncbi:NAD-P-binding protein, partial [Lentithecium fluviatile CBS 122367]
MPSAYQIHGKTQYAWQTGDGVKNLRLNTSIPKPTDIPKDHVLVHIKAASLAARDLMVMAHDPAYPGPHADDLTPGSDCAGIIEEVGEGSTAWKAGDRVIVNSGSWPNWSYDSAGPLPDFNTIAAKGAVGVQGTLREYGVFAAADLIRAPDYLTFEELATIPNAYGTAAHALFFGPRVLKRGQIVLAQGTGGVSCAAIQLAAAVGATVIATSSSDAKLEQAKELGATHTVNYTLHPSWADEVLRLTDGVGVDMLIELGGSSTIAQSLQATKVGGIVSLVGFLFDSAPSDIVKDVIFGGKTVYGVRVFTREMVEFAVGVLGEKRLKPVVGRVFGWRDGEAAGREVVGSAGVGRVVVRV